MSCVPYNVRHFDFKYILITSMGRFQLWQTKMQARFERVASYFPQQFLQVDIFNTNCSISLYTNVDFFLWIIF